MKVVKRIVIVGGGTAGWITASWFARRWSKRLDVVVIDKTQPERVGVGEATLLSFPEVMRQMNYEPKQWMNEIDATYKAGILFPGWGKKENVIWHPFGFGILGDGDNPNIPRVPLYDVWSNYQDQYDIKDISGLYKSAMKNNIEPDYIRDTYAYQIDCGKLVQFLQKNTIPFLKEYIQSDVVEVYKDGISDDITKSNIKKLVLDDGSEITGDLFIDCTGWKQMLIGENNVDLSDRLFIDTAFAAKVEYENKSQEMHPYTDCAALEHGWRWRIPTRSRIGTGYCFNRSITDPDVVADAFVKHWNNRIKKEDLRMLDWKPQYVKKFWEGNVVPIGLSAGFIEPLESTGLALMIRGCEFLEESMVDCFYNPYETGIYDIRMKCAFESAVDYVNMHYSYCEREGKFWDYVRLSHEKSGMQKYMEDQINDPHLITFQQHRSSSFFGGSNWHVWLLQLMPEIVKKEYWYEDVKEIVPRFENYLARLDSSVKQSISHKSILNHWHGK
tara:strand:- start:1388 stop:2887 length:1500 start_codon:yes stop_codon:yes gene_type:complete